MRNGGAAWAAAMVWMVACTGNGGVGAPRLEVTPAQLDFGSAPLGAPSTANITVSNVGGGAIGLLSVTLTSGDPDVWDTDRSGVQTLGAGESGEVVVTFAPERQQPYTGQLQLRTDLAGGNMTIDLLGSGGLPGGDEDQDGFSPAEGDCDDTDANVYPGAEEICDGKDSDCNGVVAAEEDDDDGDRWPVCAGDCNDADDTIYPGAPEICDDLDNDCDNITPDRLDQDSDGISICGDAEGKGPGDCDDLNNQRFPGNPEVCDDFDNDCDEIVDNLDLDGDGRSQCFGAGDCDDGNADAYPVIVSTAGSDKGLGTDEEPYATLGMALANLDAVCRTVILEDGTYDEVDETITEDVSVVGRAGDPAVVILEAAAEARHFGVTGGRVLTLEALTLTGGDASDNGGSVQVVESDLVLVDVVFDANTTGADGGAVAVTSGALRTSGVVVFSNNEAGADGGAVLLEQSQLTDTSGTAYENNSAAIGGAIRAEGGVVVVREALFTGNTAGEGGAVSAVGSGTFTFERNSVHLNTANELGGGLALRDVSSPTGFVRNNTVQDNIAGTGGGGVAMVGAVGSIAVHNNTFAGNEATSGDGAGILVTATNSSGVDVVSNVLHSNDGSSALHVGSGTGGAATYTTVFGTNSGIHFSGDVGDGSGNPTDSTNAVRNPLFVAFSDDGDPNNDDLDLQASSPEIDDGPAGSAFDDPDSSRNDRGRTGGPAAQP